MAQSSLIQVRVDEDFKKEADDLFADLGFDTPTAIRIFLKQAIKRRGLPFEVNTDINHANEIEKRLKELDELNAMVDASGHEEVPMFERARLHRKVNL